MPMRRVLLKMVGFVGNPVMTCVALKLNRRVTRFPKLYMEKPGFSTGIRRRKNSEFSVKEKGIDGLRLIWHFSSIIGGSQVVCWFGLFLEADLATWLWGKMSPIFTVQVVSLAKYHVLPSFPVFFSVFACFGQLGANCGENVFAVFVFLLALTNSRFQFHSLWAYERRKTHLALQKSCSYGQMGCWTWIIQPKLMNPNNSSNGRLNLKGM